MDIQVFKPDRCAEHKLPNQKEIRKRNAHYVKNILQHMDLNKHCGVKIMHMKIAQI